MEIMINENFHHLIITRFNLRNNSWDNFTKSKKRILTDSWLEDRFELFENFCFPSVMNQTKQNFDWWVFFDTQTPKEFRDKIHLLEKKFEKFLPIYIDGMDFCLPTIQEKLSFTKTPYIITSRLDNDDCLHYDYVNQVQSHFDFQNFLALDFVNGFSIQIQPNTKLGYRYHLYNPFLSLIESNKNPKSVWINSHSEWKKELNIKRIKDGRFWMSIIHQENKVNEYHGFGTPNFQQTLKFFGIDRRIISDLELELTYSKFESSFNYFYSVYISVTKDFKRIIGVYKIKKLLKN
jgi:hypothetical protein